MFQAPKIQRLVTPVVLQRRRHRLALKKKRLVKRKASEADYAKLLAQRKKESKVCTIYLNCWVHKLESVLVYCLLYVIWYQFYLF